MLGIDMQPRRTFIKRTAAVASSLSLALQASLGTACRTSERAGGVASVKAKRRRIIWNNDGDDLWAIAHDYKKPNWPTRYDSVEQFLRMRTSAVKGTQVDSISFCGFTDVPTWEQRFWPWVRGTTPDHPLGSLLGWWGQTREGELIERFRNSSLGPLAFSWP